MKLWIVDDDDADVDVHVAVAIAADVAVVTITIQQKWKGSFHTFIVEPVSLTSCKIHTHTLTSTSFLA